MDDEDNGSDKQRLPDVGAYIRDQRRKAQLSLRKLAERSGVATPTSARSSGDSGSRAPRS